MGGVQRPVQQPCGEGRDLAPPTDPLPVPTGPLLFPLAPPGCAQSPWQGCPFTHQLAGTLQAARAAAGPSPWPALLQGVSQQSHQGRQQGSGDSGEGRAG